ncbi:MAG: hypothetical protein IKZ19_07490 [Clostridia bacterium]|nr:hypothetical protein [Clostridia bacterium]
MKTANIIVLAGQSNAVGVGHAKYLPEHFGEEKTAEYRRGYEKVKINFYSHNFKSNGFVPVKLGQAEKGRDTFGPEVGIAEYFAENHPGEELFIVKCAFGGMSLFQDFLSPSGGENYDPGAYADQYENILRAFSEGKPIRAGWCYNELVKIVRESISILTAEGYEPKIKGFCWMQGESDGDAMWCTEPYGQRYHALLSDFKAEFGPWIENTVFADGGISPKWGCWQQMNAIKEEYARTHENCVYIDTNAQGIVTSKEPHGNVDVYHYDSDCVIKLGRLFAEAVGL